MARCCWPCSDAVSAGSRPSFCRFSLLESAFPKSLVGSLADGLSWFSEIGARFEEVSDCSVAGFWNWNFDSLFLVVAETGAGGLVDGLEGMAPE